MVADDAEVLQSLLHADLRDEPRLGLNHQPLLANGRNLDGGTVPAAVRQARVFLSGYWQ